MSWCGAEPCRWDAVAGVGVTMEGPCLPWQGLGSCPAEQRSPLSQPPASRMTSGPCPQAGLPAGHEKQCWRSLPSPYGGLCPSCLSHAGCHITPNSFVVFPNTTYMAEQATTSSSGGQSVPPTLTGDFQPASVCLLLAHLRPHCCTNSPSALGHASFSEWEHPPAM